MNRTLFAIVIAMKWIILTMHEENKYDVHLIVLHAEIVAMTVIENLLKDSVCNTELTAVIIVISNVANTITKVQYLTCAHHVCQTSTAPLHVF